MSVVIDETNEVNGVGTSRPSHNVPKRLFLEMFHPLELVVSDVGLLNYLLNSLG